MLRSITLGIWVLVVALCFSNPLAAAVYTVDDDGPADFSSIQSAINFAGSGDTILVKSGTYIEDIVLKSGVKVLGEGYKITILKGTGSGNVVWANSVTGAQLDGFTIYGSGSDHSYAGVTINGGNVVIRNNFITENINAIRIQSSASGIIRNNIIQDNGSTTDGFNNYGIICVSSTPLITNNFVVSNPETGIYFAWADSSGAQVINNTINDNGSDGIWCCCEASRPPVPEIFRWILSLIRTILEIISSVKILPASTPVIPIPYITISTEVATIWELTAEWTAYPMRPTLRLRVGLYLQTLARYPLQRSPKPAIQWGWPTSPRRCPGTFPFINIPMLLSEVTCGLPGYLDRLIPVCDIIRF